jgi:hypothetical protein
MKKQVERQIWDCAPGRKCPFHPYHSQKKCFEREHLIKQGIAVKPLPAEIKEDNTEPES